MVDVLQSSQKPHSIVKLSKTRSQAGRIIVMVGEGEREFISTPKLSVLLHAAAVVRSVMWPFDPFQEANYSFTYMSNTKLGSRCPIGSDTKKGKVLLYSPLVTQSV